MLEISISSKGDEILYKGFWASQQSEPVSKIIVLACRARAVANRSPAFVLVILFLLRVLQDMGSARAP